jgi:membrane-associated protease RseP (regulator of RpoE activity)
MKRPLFPILALLPLFASPSMAEPLQNLAKPSSREASTNRPTMRFARTMQAGSPSFVIGLGFQDASNLIVKTVIGNLPAAEAGIKAGDQILAVNKIKVSGQDALRGIITAAGAQKLKITVQRGDEKLHLSVTPKKMAQPENAMRNSSEPRPAPISRPVPATRELPAGDRILGEILGELKKMNSREGHRQPAPPVLRTAPSISRPAVPQNTNRSAPPVAHPASPAISLPQPASKAPTLRRRAVILPPTKRPEIQSPKPTQQAPESR